MIISAEKFCRKFLGGVTVKVYGVKIKTAMISAATRGISPFKLAREIGLNELDFDALARQHIGELTEQQINALAEISGFEPNYFLTDF